MSKTWRQQQKAKHTDTTPQKVIDWLRNAEAKNDIREALAASQEAPNANS